MRIGPPKGIRTAQDHRSRITPTEYWDCQSVPDTGHPVVRVDLDEVDRSALLSAEQIEALEQELLIASFYPDGEFKSAAIRAAKDKLDRHSLAALHLARTTEMIASRRSILKRIGDVLGESVAELCNQQMIAADEAAIAAEGAAISLAPGASGWPDSPMLYDKYSSV